MWDWKSKERPVFDPKLKMWENTLLGRVLLGTTVFGRLSWLGFSCSIGEKPFSVGLIDQLFQPELWVWLKRLKTMGSVR